MHDLSVVAAAVGPAPGACCEGNLSRAARESGLHRKSIERLVKKYQLDTKGMKPR
ncbi:hypothetical protein KRR26_08965 [Corallococcus sp. M34]|uniref:hypothetical protein n=1 Tax=Citreicoccus inhibens TaxID=2849499 RepID=UPI001C21A7AD|nr:hypothetical protein [Citreicoccus inhibens]MBU8895734.1 hypothetical protein [Citreicoccus inhibens]